MPCLPWSLRYWISPSKNSCNSSIQWIRVALSSTEEKQQALEPDNPPFKSRVCPSLAEKATDLALVEHLLLIPTEYSKSYNINLILTLALQDQFYIYVYTHTVWSQALKSTYTYIDSFWGSQAERKVKQGFTPTSLWKFQLCYINSFSLCGLCACSLFSLVWIFTKVCTFVLTISCYIFNPLYRGE